MKLNILIFFFLLIFSSSTFAEYDFEIRSYDVNFQVNRDGSIDVEEVIKVYFNEPRRGIFRYIPIRYKQEALGEGERRARRAVGQHIYQIYLENIEVPGNPFITYEEGANLNIRIGDRNITHTGEKTYTIRYKVWGALNDFEDWIEFSWNIIGANWNVPIREAAFTIAFETPIELREEDVIAVKGKRGSDDKVRDIRIDRQSVRGMVDGRLKPKEGISIGIAIPTTYFTATYIEPSRFSEVCIVRDVRISTTVNENAALNVKERWIVDFRYPYPFFKRKLEGQFYNSTLQSYQYPYITDEVVLINGEESKYRISRGGKNASITAIPDKGMFNGPVEVALEYTLYGVVFSSGEQDEIKFPAITFEPADPVEEAKVEFDVSQISNVEITSANWLINGSSANLRNSSIQNELISASARWDARQMERMELQASLKEADITYEMLPEEVFYENYMIEEYGVTVNLEPGDRRNRTWIEVEEQYEIKTRDHSDRVRMPLQIFTQYSAKKLGLRKSDLPARKYFGPTRINAVEEYTASAKGKGEKRSSGDMFMLELMEGDDVKVEQKLKEVMYKAGGKKNYTIALSKYDNEPVKKLELKILLERPNADQKMEAKLVSGEMEKVIKMNFDEGVWRGELEGPITFKNDPWVLQLSTGNDVGIAYSMFDRWQLFRANNKSIIASAALSLLLFLAWFFFGRDKRWDGTVYSRPPEDITSAEAGFLWDEKLHKRDLISLIFQWASKGHIRIEEVADRKDKSDYRLVKLKELEPNAKNFEKTLFDGIFKGISVGESTLVSDMRDSLYKDMRKAHKQLMKSKRAKAFFSPGTLTAAKIIMIIGVFALLVSLIAGGIGLITSNFAPAVSFFVFGIAALVFGKKMPQKSPFGTSAFHQLVGFKAFVKTAKLEELEKLYKEDSSYFNNTIAYAIVMGLGEVWAKRFANIATKPPEYYVPASPWHDFNTIILTHHMLNSMRRMNTDFNYVQPSMPSSGTSTWGGSGGSSFGGGFSSGGGFGGGGGGAW